MTKREREKQIAQRLSVKYGHEIRGLRNLAEALGIGYSTACRQLKAKIIDIDTFKRGRDIAAYTDNVAKYLAAS